MGSSTFFNGRFTLNKPLKDDLYKELINFNHTRHPDIMSYGLWCQWIPTDDKTTIVHDGGEKFYNYVEWLEYLIQHFLKPNGYILNGEVEGQGETMGDYFKIICRNNLVKKIYPVFIDDLYNQN
jgi:hypothetical protein